MSTDKDNHPSSGPVDTLFLFFRWLMSTEKGCLVRTLPTHNFVSLSFSHFSSKGKQKCLIVWQTFFIWLFLCHNFVVSGKKQKEEWKQLLLYKPTRIYEWVQVIVDSSQRSKFLFLIDPQPWVFRTINLTFVNILCQRKVFSKEVFMSFLKVENFSPFWDGWLSNFCVTLESIFSSALVFKNTFQYWYRFFQILK